MGNIIIRSYETKKSVVPPIIFLIIGIMLFINPGNIVEFISYIFGGVFLTLGIGKFVFDSRRNNKTTGDNFYSIIMICLGIIFIFFSGTIEFLIRLAIGLWISINGLNTIIIGSNLMRIEKNAMFTLIIGILLLLMGIYTIFISNLILSTLGLVLIIYAALEIADYIYLITKNK